jgi:hypothetical protein
MEQPKLRPMQAFPVDRGGRRLIGLSDLMQLADGAVFGFWSSWPRTIKTDSPPWLEAVRRIPCESALRITGFPPINLSLVTMPAPSGTVLKYFQAVASASQSMVSYASVVFH